MMEVMVQNKTESGKIQCSLSKECGLVMTKRGFTDYGITHQLLWIALAEKVIFLYHLADLQKQWNECSKQW